MKFRALLFVTVLLSPRCLSTGDFDLFVAAASSAPSSFTFRSDPLPCNHLSNAD
jgi:hypothetical protein